MALAVAVSPIQIIAVILILLSPRARTSGPAFLLGWFIGLSVVAGLTVFFDDAVGVGSASEGKSTIGAVLQLGLGALLLLLALKQWRGYRSKGDTADLPGWMAGISAASPIRAALIGAAISGVNPKILLFTISASVSIAQTGASMAAIVTALVVFVLLGSISVIVPVLWYLASPARASRTLTGWHAWLVANNALVMAIVMLVIGVNLLSKGLGGLSS